MDRSDRRLRECTLYEGHLHRIVSTAFFVWTSKTDRQTRHRIYTCGTSGNASFHDSTSSWLSCRGTIRFSISSRRSETGENTTTTCLVRRPLTPDSGPHTLSLLSLVSCTAARPLYRSANKLTAAPPRSRQH